MADSKVIYLTDRSAAETDDTCGMKYWLNRLAGGQGIVPKEEPIYFKIGRIIHEDLATIATMDDLRPESIQASIDEILAPLTDDDKRDTKKMEVLYRRLGWFAAFALYIEPEIRKRYHNVTIESEIILARDPLWVACTPDRVLEDKQDHHLVYKEYKSTKRAGREWMDSWLYAIQLHIGIAAAQEELDRKVKFGQIMGLMKGYESAVDGKLMHPYVWAYYNTSTKAWEHEYERSRGASWISMPVWEFDGGIVKWVLMVGEEVAKRQFPHSAPVFLNQRMLDEWIYSRTRREKIIRATKKLSMTDMNTRLTYFPRRLKACRPAFGDACPYRLVCWNGTWADDPSACPEFEPRQPHHDVEIAMSGGLE